MQNRFEVAVDCSSSVREILLPITGEIPLPITNEAQCLVDCAVEILWPLDRPTVIPRPNQRVSYILRVMCGRICCSVQVLMRCVCHLLVEFISALFLLHIIKCI